MEKFGYFTFVLGLATGCLFVLILTQSKHVTYMDLPVRSYGEQLINILWNQNDNSKQGKYEYSYYYRQNGTQFELTQTELIARLQNKEFYPKAESDLLFNEVRILCMVYVDKGSLNKISKAIRETWGAHCNKLIFVSSGIDKTVENLLHVDIPEIKTEAWNRVKRGFSHAYEQYRTDFNWFLKTDASIMVVPENLRYMLMVHNASVPGYSGHVFLGEKGGSSYVLSRESLEKLYPHLDKCSNQAGGNKDDVELTKCLVDVGIITSMDGRDYKKQLRFEMIVPDHKLPSNAATALSFTSRYWRYIKYPKKKKVPTATLR